MGPSFQGQTPHLFWYTRRLESVLLVYAVGAQGQVGMQRAAPLPVPTPAHHQRPMRRCSGVPATQPVRV